MRKYRRGLKKVSARKKRRKDGKPGPASPRGKLAASALAADAALKQLPGTRRCGGGAEPTGQSLRTSITESNSQELKMHVSLPTAHWTSRRGGSRDFVALDMDGTDSIGSPGDPGVPAFNRLFAIPQGADVSVDVSNVTSYTLTGVDLFPQQEQPVDQEGPPDPSVFADRPFTIDRGAFRSRAPIPAEPSDAVGLGTMRDLRVGGVQIAGARYTPRRKRLQVFTGMDVTVRFGGANQGQWRTGPRRNPLFEGSFTDVYRSALENYGTVAAANEFSANGDEPPVPDCGEEYLIVTSPALRPAADTLADLKADAGMVVSVRETGTGPGQVGTENTQIRDFIRGELNSTQCIRPSYVVLIGDTSHVPTFIEPCTSGVNGACPAASDLSYSLDGIGNDPFADVMLGRIPANTVDQASTVVSKIVAYETTPPAPAGDDFYSHASIGAFFEGPGPKDNRSYIFAAERIRSGMLASGYAVDRLYDANAASDPQRFHNDTPLPDELKRPGFPWNANTQSWLDAWNGGRSVVVHRDHGFHGGVVHPNLFSADVPSLTNGAKLPVMFSINCASAMFDLPGNPSFVERLLHHPGGGVVGAFGDTRNSPTTQNTNLAIGFADALFPETTPGQGSPEPLRHMGEVLIAGKAAMGGQAPAEQQLTGNVYVDHLLYHYLGDPSMELWRETPQVFDPAQVKTFYQGRNLPPLDEHAFTVKVTSTQPGTEGTTATLRQRGEVLGRGVIQNGEVVITPSRRTDSADLTVSLQQQRFLPRELPVSAPTPSHTITCPAPTSNTQSAITRGRVTQSGGPIKDGIVRIRYTDPSGDVFTDSDLTDDNGEWASTRVPPLERGTWKVEAFFDDKGVKDATCNFTVP